MGPPFLQPLWAYYYLFQVQTVRLVLTGTEDPYLSPVGPVTLTVHFGHAEPPNERYLNPNESS